MEFIIYVEVKYVTINTQRMGKIEVYILKKLL